MSSDINNSCPQPNGRATGLEPSRNEIIDSRTIEAPLFSEMIQESHQNQQSYQDGILRIHDFGGQRALFDQITPLSITDDLDPITRRIGHITGFLHGPSHLEREPKKKDLEEDRKEDVSNVISSSDPRQISGKDLKSEMETLVMEKGATEVADFILGLDREKQKDAFKFAALKLIGQIHIGIKYNSSRDELFAIAGKLATIERTLTGTNGSIFEIPLEQLCSGAPGDAVSPYVKEALDQAALGTAELESRASHSEPNEEKLHVERPRHSGDPEDDGEIYNDLIRDAFQGSAFTPGEVEKHIEISNSLFSFPKPETNAETISSSDTRQISDEDLETEIKRLVRNKGAREVADFILALDQEKQPDAFSLAASDIFLQIHEGNQYYGFSEEELLAIAEKLKEIHAILIKENSEFSKRSEEASLVAFVKEAVFRAEECKKSLPKTNIKSKL